MTVPALSLELQQVPIEPFRRTCTRWGCGKEVPYDRLKRGSDTCSNECKQADRKLQRRFQRELRLAQVARSRKLQRMIRDSVRTAHTGDYSPQP